MAQVDESFIIVSLVYRLKIVTIEFISFHEMIDHNPALFCVSEQVLLFIDQWPQGYHFPIIGYLQNIR